MPKFDNYFTSCYVG